jgi:hypothetical protein
MAFVAALAACKPVGAPASASAVKDVPATGAVPAQTADEFAVDDPNEIASAIQSALKEVDAEAEVDNPYTDEPSGEGSGAGVTGNGNVSGNANVTGNGDASLALVGTSPGELPSTTCAPGIGQWWASISKTVGLSSQATAHITCTGTCAKGGTCSGTGRYSVMLYHATKLPPGASKVVGNVAPGVNGAQLIVKTVNDIGTQATGMVKAKQDAATSCVSQCGSKGVSSWTSCVHTYE